MTGDAPARCYWVRDGRDLVLIPGCYGALGGLDACCCPWETGELVLDLRRAGRALARHKRVPGAAEVEALLSGAGAPVPLHQVHAVLSRARQAAGGGVNFGGAGVRLRTALQDAAGGAGRSVAREARRSPLQVLPAAHEPSLAKPPWAGQGERP